MKIKLLSNTAKLPTKGSVEAAGYDLYANITSTTSSIEIAPHTTELIGTGLTIEIPTGYWAGIYARSGLAAKQGLRPANCCGVIDSDYRGELKVALHNDTDNYQYISHGDRIAQLVFHKHYFRDEEWEVVNELTSTDRGDGGFGSTGTN